nr:hypothetical protein GCM10020092_071400 [Actinoplanes digitatis]
MVATDVDTGRAEALSDFTDRADLIGSLHASGLLPMLAGDPVTLRGRRWLDGGIVEAVPVVAAAARGATHAVVLATRPPGTQPSFGAVDVVVERYLRRLNPELAAAYRGSAAPLPGDPPAGTRRLEPRPEHARARAPPRRPAAVPARTRPGGAACRPRRGNRRRTGGPVLPPAVRRATRR